MKALKSVAKTKTASAAGSKSKKGNQSTKSKKSTPGAAAKKGSVGKEGTMNKSGAGKRAAPGTAPKTRQNKAGNHAVKKQTAYLVYVEEVSSWPPAHDGLGRKFVCADVGDMWSRIDELCDDFHQAHLGELGTECGEWEYDAREKWRKGRVKASSKTIKLGEYVSGWDQANFPDCWQDHRDEVDIDVGEVEAEDWQERLDHEMVPSGGSIVFRFGMDHAHQGIMESLVRVSKVDLYV